MSKSYKEKSIKKNIVLNVMRMGFNMIFPLIVFPYVSQKLGPNNLGKVSFATSVVNYFIIIATMGIPTYGTIICAKEREDKEQLRRTICELIYISLALVMFSYIVFFVMLFCVPKFYEEKALFLISSLSIIFTSLGLDWLYIALEEFSYITKRSVITKIISVFLILCFINQSDDYMLYALISILATVGSNIFNIVHARPYLKFYAIKELDLRRHYKPIIVFFAASVAGTINSNTDSTMLGFLKGDYAVGIYSFSVKIKTFLVSVMTAGLSVMVPRFSYYVAQKEFERYRNCIRVAFIGTMAIAFPLCVFFVTNAEQVIMVLGGSEYAEAKFPMIVLTICVLVLGVTWTLGVGVLQPLGRENEYARVMLMACVVNIFFNAILIPICGVTGASIATLVTEIFNMYAFYYYAKSFLNGCLKKSEIVKIAVSALASTLVSVWINQRLLFDGLIKLGIVFLVQIFLYVLFVVILHKEIRQLIKQNLRWKAIC